MTHSETETLLLELATLLDAVQPLLDREATAEQRREAGKIMRARTWANRAKAARDLVDRSAALLHRGAI